MFTKKTVRNTKSAVVALLLATSCIMVNSEVYGMKLNAIEQNVTQVAHEVEHEPVAEPMETPAANPDFISAMTSN